MRQMRACFVRIAGIFSKSKRDRELAAELESHLQLHIDDNIRVGMSPQEARRRAIIKLGGIESTKENYRDRRSIPIIETLLQDVRFGLRMFRKNPGFTAVAVLTLALGIGANSAIFSVVNSAVLRPLPYPGSKRLVWITNYLPSQKRSAVYDADYFAWRRHCTSFAEITAYAPGAELTLSGTGDAERLTGFAATWTFLRTLGVTPQLGRDISPEEDIPNGPRVVLLSDSLWRRRFSADTGVLGRTVTLDENLYTIIGVLPKGFEFPENRKSELLVPLALEDSEAVGGLPIRFLPVIARLKPGVTAQSAEADLDSVAHPLHASWSNRLANMLPDSRAQVMNLQERFVGNVREALLLLLGAVGFVLLIACANVANLQLARAAARGKEIAVRGALGAGRGRLARQLLTESTLIGLAGGAAGLELGIGIVALVRHYGPRNIPHLDATSLDGSVVLFTVAISFLTGILGGLAPIISSFRTSLTDSLSQGGAQASAGKKVVRPQQALMTLELAMALVLLIGAGLLERSFVRLISIPPGFDPHGVITARIALPAKTYLSAGQQRTFYSELMERVQALPGVSSAGAAAVLPFDGNVLISGLIEVEGRPVTEKLLGSHMAIAQNMVSPDYFNAMQIPLKAGRYLDRRDGATAPETTVVNETFARDFFPNENAVGRRIQVGGSTNNWCTIVGVVGDTKQGGIASKTMPETFYPLEQFPFPDMTIVIRTAADPRTIVPEMRAAVASVDKNVPLSRVETLEEFLAGQLASQRFNVALLVSFATLALLLAAVGIYGVTAYAVGQRKQEIGIRMALGALPQDVLKLVIWQGMKFAALGVIIGIAAALSLTRLVRSLLFEVRPTDVTSYVTACAVLITVALAACLLPAWRAARVDPATSLRYD